MITVYGASDDLIEVEGDIEEEFNVYDVESSYLAFSDGTVLEVRYTNKGLWKIDALVSGGLIVEKIFSATNPDSDQYSDIVKLDGEDMIRARWILFGTDFKSV